MNADDYKCIACNAELKFNPKSQKWKCEYCGAEYGIEDLKKINQIKKTKEKNKNNEYRQYHCSDCGAEIVMDDNTSVTECIYCGNTAIISERLEGKFEPKKLIPFATNKDDAIQAFLKYKKGKWFIPNEFSQKKNIEKIKGIYIPFYLYDIDTETTIYVDAKRKMTWNDGFFKYTKTENFDVMRSGKMHFENIPVDASKKFQDDIMDSIEPYDYNALVEFDSGYISGFLAEKYDLSIAEMAKRAKYRAENTARAALKNEITGYDYKVIKRCNSVSKNGNTSEYVLLPVWLLNIKYNDKIYPLAMNGQTGKFIGNVPISWKKVCKYWIIIFALVSIIVALFEIRGFLSIVKY